MRSAERVRLIEQIASIGHVQRRQFRRPCAERRSGGNVEGHVRRKMRRTIAFEKAGAVGDRRRYPRRARQTERGAGAQRVALIVIEEEVLFARTEVGESAADAALAFHPLMRERGMNVETILGELLRLQCRLEAANMN